MSHQVSGASLLAMVIEDCEDYGIHTDWYSDDCSLRCDVLGYAKRRLGYHPDDREYGIEALFRLAQAMGFTPDRKGLGKIVALNDRYSSRRVIRFMKNRLKKVQN